jgi:hypothetical protein
MLTCQLKKRTLTENINLPGLLGVGIELTTETRKMIFPEISKGMPGPTQGC